jgi:hypothetical protein
LPILSGSMRLPTGRPWSGVVDVHSEALALAELSPASIVLTREDGTEDVFSGVVRRAALNAGRSDLCVTVVAGQGLLARTIPPRDHAPGVTKIPAGLIARGICEDAGELLASGVEEALDKLTVRRWTRFAGPGSAALDLLAATLKLAWRFLPAGRVWVGAPAWVAGPELRRLGYALEDGGRRYGPDGGQVLPGQLLEDGRVSDVVYMFGGPLRAEARDDVAGDPSHVPELDLYRATYSATIVSQAPDGSLELVPDDDRLGDRDHPLRGVDLRCGIPGARITYQAPGGERVRIAFESADPRAAYAVPAHDQAAAGATVRGVARVGDPVRGGTISGRADLATGVITFIYVSADGLTTTEGIGGVPVQLDGLVAGGSSEVKIRWP